MEIKRESCFPPSVRKLLGVPEPRFQKRWSLARVWTPEICGPQEKADTEQMILFNKTFKCVLEN